MRRANWIPQVAGWALIAGVGAGPAAAQPAEANYDEAKVPAYTLPDPLRFVDGTPVRDSRDWTDRRRAEVLRLFEAHVYGRSPAAPVAMRSVVVETDPRALGGLATRRQVRVLLDGTDAGPAFEILLYVPNAAPRPVPVFVGLNFGGNHTVHPDPGIRLSTTWMREGAGVVDHKATEAARGSGAASWPVERILDRGYALATAYYGDIEPDHADGWKDGVRSRLGPGTAGRFGPDDWGAIGAWAWGLSRGLDVLAKDADVDARRVAVIGHSRLGKTALWAGASDERFAMVVSNDSGEGGAALARRRFGETTERITRVFPHWFCARYREYADREDALPVDQHELLALVAPRPLYVASATEDLWADPRGELLAAKAAEPVYRLLGLDGLGVEDLPVPDRPVGKTIGYHLRRGPHALAAYDWENYLDFADRHLQVEAVRCQVETQASALEQLQKKIDDVLWFDRVGDVAEIDKVYIPTVPVPKQEETYGIANTRHPFRMWTYVFVAKGADAAKKRPLLLLPHGGVHGDFGTYHTHIVRELMKEGYVVVAPEYRGSTGYGREYREAIDYGGLEVDDVVAARDWAVATLPTVDPARVGIVGWSHGGLIALMAGFDHPEKFQAVYAGVPVSDLVARMGYQTEAYRRLFSAPYHIGKTAGEAVDEYRRRSPVTHVQKLKVPLLVHTSTNDRDVNVVEVQSLIAALKAAGKDFEYKVYEDAPGGHSFNRMDYPLARESRAEVYRFLARHLKK